jgi:signal transduction histidine kinase
LPVWLRRYSGLSLRSRGLLIVSIPLLFEILLLGGLVAMDRAERRRQSEELRAKEITGAAYRLMSRLVDAETGIRGYIITREPPFTEPYDRAMLEVPRELEHLRAIAPRLAEEIAAVQRLATAVLRYATLERDRVRDGRHEEAASIVQSGEGKRLMDAARASMSRFLERQRQLDVVSARDHAEARGAMRQVFLAGLLANIAAAGAMAWFFSAGIVQRLAIVVENTRRLEREETLHPRAGGTDEIAQLDDRFHDMAAALEQGRRALELTNRELDAFSYSVSHDLRAPLRAVSGYARMLEEDYGAQVDGEGRRFLQTIRREAQRMGQLIDDLLAFSRLGRNALQVTNVDMTAVAREILPDVLRTTEARVEVEVQELPQARGDRNMLRQVLVNLLTNAVKFSARNPKARVTVGASAADGENVYWVRDNGVGFDMRYAEKLFGVFQRLHAANEFEGTGVGLAIVQRVIHRHGGRVWAEAKEGEGACFSFALPASAEGTN